MAKKAGGKSFWDNPFGGLFDFNHDGKEDVAEQWLATKIFQECTKEASSRDTRPRRTSPVFPTQEFPAQNNYEAAADKYAWRMTCEKDLGIGVCPEDYETEEEYKKAFEAARTVWRLDAMESSEFGIDPFDYRTQEEYEQALEKARLAQAPSVTIPVSLSFEFTYRGKEELEAIRESDYPNKRQYQAAYRLCEVRLGTAFISSNSSPEEEIARCTFILNSDTIAAKYLTVFDGFLFAQAVKEHFTLPIAVADEDQEVVTPFEKLLLELADADAALAVKVWSWCIQEFGPYSRYMKNKWRLYNGILCSSKDYPPEFVDLALQEMADHPLFLSGVLEKNPAFPAAAPYIVYALKHEQPDIAARMFRSALAHPAGKGKDLEDFIEEILSGCRNWDELETMEAFKFHILPILAQTEDARIQRLLPRFRESVDSYIYDVESRCRQYQYSRRFAWRKTCADGSQYGLDPLRYETAQEYNNALQQRKYGWRRLRSQQAERYGVLVTDYETEEAFRAAVAEIQRNMYPQRTKAAEDSLADTDDTVYTFCGVVFPNSSMIYHYRTQDDSLAIGDMVIVPVGRDGREEIAEIVTVQKHRRKTAPYPVDRAKFIKCRYVLNKRE